MHLHKNYKSRDIIFGKKKFDEFLVYTQKKGLKILKKQKDIIT